MMKKTVILSCLLCMATLETFAQLTVDSLGTVKVHSLFHAYRNGSDTLSVIMGLDGYGISVRNRGPYTLHGSTPYRFGMYVTNFLTDDAQNVGFGVNPSGTTTQNEYGVVGRSGNSTSGNYGVYGGFASPATVANGAGIFGSVTTSMRILSQYTGRYAGYFIGDVRVVDGSINGTLLTPSGSKSSASAGSRSYTVVSSDGLDESVSDKLEQLQLIQFYRESESDSDGEEQPDSNNASATSLHALQYGLLAEELRSVYPELVYEDANGNISINYVEMIPLLVQAVNELKAEVEELKGANGTDVKQKPRLSAGAPMDEAQDETLLLSLGQNNPNPFSEETSIEVCVPEGIASASLLVFDMQGKQVKKMAVEARGTSRVTVTGQGLTEGMYLYSLIADGRVVQTRKMILSK